MKNIKYKIQKEERASFRSWRWRKRGLLHFALSILYFAFPHLTGCAPEQPLAPPLTPSVLFSDPELDAAVRHALLKSRKDNLLPSDLARLKWFSADMRGITDLEGIQNLTSLTHLILSRNQIENISPLSKLTSLTLLYLNNNRVRDISPLSTLTSLGTLDVAGNQVRDISALSGLKNLWLFYANGNRIDDLTPLSGLTQLEIVRLSNNEIADIAPLSEMVALNTLTLGGNRIEDIAPLAGLTALRYLDLAGNRISNISPLVDNGGIGAFDTVILNGNPLDGQALSAHISTLKARRVTVTVEGTGL